MRETSSSTSHPGTYLDQLSVLLLVGRAWAMSRGNALMRECHFPEFVLLWHCCHDTCLGCLCGSSMSTLTDLKALRDALVHYRLDKRGYGLLHVHKVNRALHGTAVFGWYSKKEVERMCLIISDRIPWTSQHAGSFDFSSISVSRMYALKQSFRSSDRLVMPSQYSVAVSGPELSKS